MRRRTCALLLGCVVLLTGGCSGSAGGDSGGDGDSSSSSSATESTEAVPSDATVEPSDGAVPEVGEPVAERQIVDQGWTMTLAMFPLERDSGGLVLNARLTYDKAGPENAPGDMLANDGAFSHAVGAPNGFALVDKPGGKVYLPAVDDNDSSLCSPDLGGNIPAAGDQVYVSCLFGAPPEDTAEVDVRAARFGVFSGVPVE